MKLFFISGWGANCRVFNHIRSSVSHINSVYLNWFELLCSEKILKLGKTLEHDEKNIFIGWSLGGVLALQISHLIIGKISGLILISSTARIMADFNYDGISINISRAMLQQIRINPKKLIKNFFLQCAEGSKSEIEIPKLEKESLSMDYKHLEEGLHFLFNTDARGILNNINIPVRIIHGTKDKIIPLNQAKSLAKNIENASLEIAKNSSHLLLFEQPSIIINEINSIIAYL